MTSRAGLGFTLIELLLSAALMSMILAGAYLCLRAGVLSQDLVNSREDVLQNARVALTLLTADLRSACALAPGIDFVGMHRLLDESPADNLDFATHNYTPRHPRESDWCEVSYFVDKNQETGELSLWRRRDPTPDDDPFSGGKREEIARGLAGLRLEYYDGFEWFDDWGDRDGHGKAQTSMRDRPNLSGFPEAVRITLSMDPSPRTKKKTTTPDKDTTEPPVVFQTVARLNLAALASTSGGSGGASTNSTPSNNPGAPGAGGAAP